MVLGWVLFYCTNLTQLGQTFGLLFGQVGTGFTNTQMNITLLNNLPLLLVCILGSTPIPRFIGMIFSGLCAENPKAKPKKRIVYTFVVYVFDLVLLGLSVVSLIGSSFNPFLYFRF